MISIIASLFGFLSFTGASRSSTSDESIQTGLTKKLSGKGILKDHNMEINVQNQQVTLTGMATTLIQKERAEEIATKTEGVKKVKNNLIVQTTNRSDQQIGEDVAAKIQSYVFYDIFDWVDVHVNNGVVTLSGWAHQPWHKTEYEHRVESVPGVRGVLNKIEVLPLSTNDDRLRFQVARRIYDHSILDRYAFRVHPPIHIVVNRGVVTLKGVVHSKLEERLTAILARESKAFRVIDDLRVETDG